MIYAEAHKGTTLFVTTHYMDEGGDRVSIMVEGCIEALDTPRT
jgi:ABC-2 type transport system ATP-binding protein